MKTDDRIDAEALRRWRLILGPHGEDLMAAAMVPDSEAGRLSRADAKRDYLLHYLHAREYQGRQAGPEDRTGGSAPPNISAPEWLSGVRELFPQSTVEILQRQALDRYRLSELILDPEVLAQATPNMDLVKSIMCFRTLLPPAAKDTARRIIRRVVRDLEERLARKTKNMLSGPRLRHLHGGKRRFQNMDWKTTIRRNLRHYDPEEEVLLLERLYFYRRDHRRIPWRIFIVVDQSGSMGDSVIHSAVLGSIFYTMKSLESHLIVFDTEVVDLTGQIDDPVEVLLGVQLGGGTDIGSAMAYTAQKIEHPDRTMVVLITDFQEGADPGRLISVVRRLKEDGVVLLGLAALDDRANPDYHYELARRLTDLGMEIGAMTPEKLAEWVADVMAGNRG